MDQAERGPGATDVVKPREPIAPEGFIPFLVRALSDPKYFILRVLPCLGLLLGVILAGIVGTIKLVGVFAPPIGVTVQKSGAVELTLPNRSRTSWFLLSSTGRPDSPWTNTGIQVPDDRDIRITASGRATMAIHHIIAAADSPTMQLPLHPWVGPNGLDEASPLPPRRWRPEDGIRSKHLLVKEEHQGKLLAFISATQPPARPNKQSVIAVGEEVHLRAGQHTAGSLWLAVNEIWLDEVTLDGLKHDEPARAERYEAISKDRYANAWYDDNVGEFLVIVEVN